MDSESSPIACSLEHADLAERRERWRRFGERATMSVTTTEAGLRLVFRDAPGIEEELHRLAELERACCAFADWCVHKCGEGLALDVTAASQEGIVAVQAMFRDLRLARWPTNC